MTRTETIEAVKEAARLEGIDPELYLAICTVESSLNPLAVRFEPTYRWVVHPTDWSSRFYITPSTEEALQKFSYGASQIMGAVMRELGYSAHLALWVTDQKAPILLGAKHLKRFLVRYGSEEQAIASYNAGSPRRTPGGMFVNQIYVDKVYKELRKLRTLV